MYGIFTYIWLIFMVNVGKYTSPMDPMGMKNWTSDLSKFLVNLSSLPSRWKESSIRLWYGILAVFIFLDPMV